MTDVSGKEAVVLLSGLKRGPTRSFFPTRANSLTIDDKAITTNSMKNNALFDIWLRSVISAETAGGGIDVTPKYRRDTEILLKQSNKVKASGYCPLLNVPKSRSIICQSLHILIITK